MSKHSEITNEEFLADWQKAIKELKDYAKTVTTTYAPSEWLPAMRNQAAMVGVDRDVRDKELLTYLADANPAGEPIEPGSVIDESLLRKPGNLWGKLLVHGGINLLVSAPKVGKTALMMHFAGCVLRGEQECLGIPIENPFDHLIIVGPDMHVDQWMALLQREGLADGAKLSDKVTLWHSATQISLSDQGIARIKGKCQRHLNSLLLIDTLSSSISSMNLDENRSEIAVPLMALRTACASVGTSITTVVNHHASKQGYGSSGTTASRGSSALPGACDSTISLNYFRQGIDGVERTDRRLVLSSEGRNGCQTLMAEMVDTVDGVKWMAHGDASNHRAVEALWAAQEGLSNRQEEAYDLACNFHEQDRLIEASDLASHLNLTRQKALRVLKSLERKGLLVLVKAPFEGGHRAPNRYRAVTEDEALTPSTPLTPSTHHVACARDLYMHHETGNPVEGSKPNPMDDSKGVKGFKGLKEGQTVQRLVDGTWQSGWVISDGTNPDRLKIAKLGNPMLTFSNLRWELDVREATGSPFADPPAEEQYEEFPL